MLTFLLLPETLFDRDAALHERHASVNETSVEDKAITEVADTLEGSKLYGVTSTGERPTLTYIQTLGFPKPRPGFATHFIAPVLALRLPGTIMVMLLSAALIALIISISAVGPQVLEAPPYLWGANVGLINVAGILGILLGGIYTYLLTDWFTKRSSEREIHGFAEPEVRLPLMLPVLALATGGSLVFGFCAQNPSSVNDWVGLAFGYVSVESLADDVFPLKVNRVWCPSV